MMNDVTGIQGGRAARSLQETHGAACADGLCRIGDATSENDSRK